MTYARGIVQPPDIIFMDGSAFEVLQTAIITKKGIPYLRLIMSPFRWTMDMLEIDDKDLDFSNYERGVIVREYPRSLVFKVSENPEKPIWWGLCSFDGTTMTVKNKDLQSLLELTDENENLKHRIHTLEGENARLREDSFNMAIKLQEHFETQREFVRPTTETIPFSPMEEVEIKTKKKAGE